MYDVFKCARAAVYHNTRRLSPAQIQKETGCTHIINGYYFDNDSKSKTYFQPLGWLIVDGKTLSTDKWQDWGFACDKAGAPAMSTDRTKDYFIGALSLLKDGAICERELTPDVKAPSYRTAIAWLADGRVLLWCEKKKLKVPELVEKLLALGAVDAIAMDGGGSSQCIFPDGKVTSTRKVPTLILFWESEEDVEPEGEKPMVEINAYSLKKDGNKQLSKNFKVKEFACQDGTDTIFVARELPMVLQYIRMRTGKALTINSAYRTESRNKAVGGTAGSQHLYGTAADIKTPSGYTPAKMATIAREIMPDWGGVGIYSWGIHVDVREKKSDWNG